MSRLTRETAETEDNLRIKTKKYLANRDLNSSEIPIVFDISNAKRSTMPLGATLGLPRVVSSRVGRERERFSANAY